MEVIVYSAEWCPWCHKTKEFLKKHNVEFVDRDVGENQEYAVEAMEKSGQTGIPVTIIDGQVVVGFDVARLKELLKLK